MTVFQASIVLPAKDPPPYCFSHYFPHFRLQNPDDTGDIFSTLPQRNSVPSKIGIQGGRHNFAPTTTVNSLPKITLRIKEFEFCNLGTDAYINLYNAFIHMYICTMTVTS